MKRLVLLLFGMAVLAAPAPQLEPRVHFLHGWEGGDVVQMYYEIPRPLVPNNPFGDKPTNSPNLEVKTVSVKGLPLKGWKIVEAFSKREIELTVQLSAGLDVSFRSLVVNGSSLDVAPSRVMYLKPNPKYPLSYEKLEQQPTDKLLLGMQIFNDSPDTITIEKILYAPSAVSRNQVLVNPRYDSDFFSKLERWEADKSPNLPTGLGLSNANALNLKILPSRGFGAAILGISLKKDFSCRNSTRPRDPAKRYDTFISQPVIQYRVGTGKPMLYPIPDQIITDICP